MVENLKKTAGNKGEDLAAKYLQSSGYKILGRNVRTKVGEIDILAKSNAVIVLVEVKTKSTKDFGEGYEMVNYFKKTKLLQLAKSLHIKYPESVIRIDIISVDISVSPPQIKHFESAIEEHC